MHVWKTENEMDADLIGCTEKEKTNKLTIQIKFHRNVLKSKVPNKLFCLSSTIKGKRKVYNAEKLRENL